MVNPQLLALMVAAAVATGCGRPNARLSKPNLGGDTRQRLGDEHGDAGCIGTQCTEQQAMIVCETVADAFCDYIEPCFGGTHGQCLAENLAANCTEAGLLQPIRDGKQYIDVGSVNMCISLMGQLDCMSREDFAAHPAVEVACTKIPAGKISPGGACATSNDCSGLQGYCNISTCEERLGEEYEQSCGSAADCLTGANVCVPFADNVQGLEGMCTRPCPSQQNAECGIGGACVWLASTAAHYCVSKCLDNSWCSHGFICAVPNGYLVGICTVEPI